MKYLLIKDQVIKNIIKADSMFISRVEPQYDMCVEVADTVSAGPGDGYVNGEIIPQPTADSSEE